MKLQQLNKTLILLIAFAALISLATAQVQYPYGTTPTSYVIDVATQDLYVESIDRISPLQRAQWQSPIQNYFMFKALGWSDLNGD